MRHSRSRTLKILVSTMLFTFAFATHPLAAEKATFALPWIPYGNQIYVYVAKEKGHFARTGADVDIIRGFGSGDTAKKVAAGSVQFGIADFGAVALARSQDAKVKGTLFLQPKSFLAAAYVVERGISRPKDLEGKSGGTAPFNAAWQFMPAFALLAGFDIAKVKFVSMDAAVAFPAFLKGEIQWLPIFLTELPSLIESGKKLNLTVKAFTYADYGLQVASNAVIFSDSAIASNPKFVMSATQAIKEAFIWSIENPEDAVDIFIKYNPVADRSKATGEWRVGVEHALTPEVEKWGVGYLPPTMIQEQIEVIRKYLKITKSLSAEEVMTLAFIGEKAVPRVKK